MFKIEHGKNRLRGCMKKFLVASLCLSIIPTSMPSVFTGRSAYAHCETRLQEIFALGSDSEAVYYAEKDSLLSFNLEQAGTAHSVKFGNAEWLIAGHEGDNLVLLSKEPLLEDVEFGEFSTTETNDVVAGMQEQNGVSKLEDGKFYALNSWNKSKLKTSLEAKEASFTSAQKPYVLQTTITIDDRSGDSPTNTEGGQGTDDCCLYIPAVSEDGTKLVVGSKTDSAPYGAIKIDPSYIKKSCWTRTPGNSDSEWGTVNGKLKIVKVEGETSTIDEAKATTSKNVYAVCHFNPEDVLFASAAGDSAPNANTPLTLRFKDEGASAKVYRDATNKTIKVEGASGYTLFAQSELDGKKIFSKTIEDNNASLISNAGEVDLASCSVWIEKTDNGVIKAIKAEEKPGEFPTGSTTDPSDPSGDNKGDAAIKVKYNNREIDKTIGIGADYGDGDGILDLAAFDADDKATTVTWSVKNNDDTEPAVEVKENKVVIVGAGNATITATTTDNKTFSFPIEVDPDTAYMGFNIEGKDVIRVALPAGTNLDEFDGLNGPEIKANERFKVFLVGINDGDDVKLNIRDVWYRLSYKLKGTDLYRVEAMYEGNLEGKDAYKYKLSEYEALSGQGEGVEPFILDYAITGYDASKENHYGDDITLGLMYGDEKVTDNVTWEVYDQGSNVQVDANGKVTGYGTATIVARDAGKYASEINVNLQPIELTAKVTGSFIKDFDGTPNVDVDTNASNPIDGHVNIELDTTNVKDGDNVTLDTSNIKYQLTGENDWTKGSTIGGYGYYVEAIGAKTNLEGKYTVASARSEDKIGYIRARGMKIIAPDKLTYGDKNNKFMRVELDPADAPTDAIKWEVDGTGCNVNDYICVFDDGEISITSVCDDDIKIEAKIVYPGIGYTQKAEHTIKGIAKGIATPHIEKNKEVITRYYDGTKTIDINSDDPELSIGLDKFGGVYAEAERFEFDSETVGFHTIKAKGLHLTGKNAKNYELSAEECDCDYFGDPVTGQILAQDKTQWGTEVNNSGVINYVAADGTTSVEISRANADENGIVWLKEESDGTSAWYGIDNSQGVFTEGSRLHVRWLSQDTDREAWEQYYAQIDDEHKKAFVDNKMWIFLIGVTDPNGTEYTNFGGSSVPVYIQLGDDWDFSGITALFISSGRDEIVDLSYIGNQAFPAGSDEFVKLNLKHFSPYAVGEPKKDNGDKADSDDKNGKGSSAVKTGDSVNSLVIGSLCAVALLSGGLIVILKKKRRA